MAGSGAVDSGADTAAPGRNGQHQRPHLQRSNFDSEVLRSDVPVLVDFSATWCGPCKTIEPTVNAIAGEYAGRLKVGKVDVDENDATADRYNVEAMPTLLLFKNGRVAGQIVGTATRSEVERMVRANL